MKLEIGSGSNQEDISVYECMEAMAETSDNTCEKYKTWTHTKTEKQTNNASNLKSKSI